MATTRSDVHGRALRRSVAALAFAAAASATARTADDQAAQTVRVSACFAPGTSPEYIDEIESLAEEWTLKSDPIAHWSATATNGGNLARGHPITLTWAVVPDGTTVPAGLGRPSAPSDLRAFLNGVYGSESKWSPLFERVFARWSEVTGVKYVHETADDGSTLQGLPGRLGVRADIRIGGKPLDGDFGVLAYASFPDDGDIVVDTNDAWFRNTGLDSRRLRNVVAHEHGHSLGLDHVCPVDGTKLMEPVVSIAIDGPQHDDILGAQRLYGDPMENNDALATATDLGAPPNETKVTVDGVGIDDADDTDLFAFTAPVGTNVDVTLKPFGKTYPIGTEGSGGKCGTTTIVDTRANADLRLALLDVDGSVIASADATRAGGNESLVDVPLPSGAGRYFVRVRNSGEHVNQMYTLDLVAGQRGEKPVAVADHDSTWEVLPVATAVLANDSGLGDVPIRLRVSTPPTAGRAIVDGDRIVYVPPRGFIGDARYSYEVSDVHTETATAEVVVTVRASARAGAARVDTDGDGYPDEFESARGTSPADAASIPGDDIGGGAPTLVVTSLRLTLRSGRASTDEVALAGRLPVAAGFEPLGAHVVASVAGVVREFVLDANGRSVERADSKGVGGPAFRLRLRRRKGAVVGEDVRFDLRLTGGDFAASWTDEGIATNRNQTREPRAATVIVILAGRTRIATIPLLFTARKGANGVARSTK
jgi:hypothetical protein